MARSGRWRMLEEKFRNRRVNKYRETEDVVREGTTMAQEDMASVRHEQEQKTFHWWKECSFSSKHSRQSLR